MKKSMLAIVATIAFFAACNNAEKSSTPASSDTTVVTEKKETTVSPAKSCFSHIKGKDSVSLSFTENNNIVSGDLMYNYFEKDKNTGTINGRFSGDTLIADYTFMSEGKNAVREVIFLRSGNSLTEGYGDMIERDGKMVFKNHSSIRFSNDSKLDAGDCK